MNTAIGTSNTRDTSTILKVTGRLRHQLSIFLERFLNIAISMGTTSFWLLLRSLRNLNNKSRTQGLDDEVGEGDGCGHNKGGPDGRFVLRCGASHHSPLSCPTPRSKKNPLERFIFIGHGTITTSGPMMAVQRNQFRSAIGLLR